MFPGRGQRHVGIQGGERPAARPGSLPPQREHSGLTAGHHFQEMHLDQFGHARRRTQRADPDQASKAITVGSLRGRGLGRATRGHVTGRRSARGDEHQGVKGARRRVRVGVTLGAIRTNDLTGPWTYTDSRRERARGQGLI